MNYLLNFEEMRTEMKNGDIVRLIEDTRFYKKGTKAIVVDICGDSQKFELRYEGEGYEGDDVDIMPKALFECVESGGR